MLRGKAGIYDLSKVSLVATSDELYPPPFNNELVGVKSLVGSQVSRRKGYLR